LGLTAHVAFSLVLVAAESEPRLGTTNKVLEQNAGLEQLASIGVYSLHAQGMQSE